MHLLLSHHSKLPLLSSGNHHTNRLWKKTVRSFIFLCHHLMQLCHFFAHRLLISLLLQWPNLPTEISQPPGKILTDQCLPPLWPPKCQQTLLKSSEIVQFFIQLRHFSSCHLQNFMLLPWPNRNRNILAPDKITTGQCPLLSDHPLPKRTVKKAVRLCILMHFHNYNFATYKFPSCRNGRIHQQGYLVPQAKEKRPSPLTSLTTLMPTETVKKVVRLMIFWQDLLFWPFL